MNKREASNAAQSCARVVDDFGATGKVVGWAMGNDDFVLVRWDCDAPGNAVRALVIAADFIDRNKE